MGVLRRLVKIPFHSQICVAHTVGSPDSSSTKDGKIGSVNIKLQVVRQAVVQFVVGSILPKIRKLRMLKGVEFVEELEVPFSLLGHPRIICVERQLRLH